MSSQEKYCPHCKLIKSTILFYKSNKRRKSSYCKECSKIVSKKWRKDNKDKYIKRYKKDNIWRKYKITLEERDALLSLQNNECAICHTTTPRQYGWNVDHNKENNKIRGILCSKCNTGIGLFDHSIFKLKQAIYYLETRNV